MSDIHGEYEKYLKMINKINLTEDDTLYILGDILDRGPNPIKIILDLMKRTNVEIIAGNHEIMAIECLRFLCKEITKENIADIDDEIIEKLLNWQQNGSASTIDEFHKLDKIMQHEVIEFISDFKLYEEITVGGKEYIFVHAGLGGFESDKEMWEYELHELVWERPDYETAYYHDKYVVTGHTPTTKINNNPCPGYIYKKHNHIAIDCGASFGGKLACLCLDTMEEFYV